MIVQYRVHGLTAYRFHADGTLEARQLGGNSWKVVPGTLEEWPEV